MKQSSSEKLESWRGHVAAAESHAAGVTAYCAAEGLKISTYYSWRKFIKGSQGQSKRRPKIQKTIRPFLPVEIVRPDNNEAQRDFCDLPDARWVAAVMVHLVRGVWS